MTKKDSAPTGMISVFTILPITFYVFLIYVLLSVGYKGAFHLVRTHLGGRGGRCTCPIYFHCVLHAKRGGGSR